MSNTSVVCRADPPVPPTTLNLLPGLQVQDLEGRALELDAAVHELQGALAERDARTADLQGKLQVRPRVVSRVQCANPFQGY